MPTYNQIIDYAWRQLGVKIHHTCWIADVKARYGLTARLAPNRQSADYRLVTCPPSKVGAIEAAMRHFGMIA